MTRRVILVANQKGGVGKTTIAGNLCGVLHEKGYQVKGVDCDPQRSLLAWSRLGSEQSDLRRRFPVPVVENSSRMRLDAEYNILDLPPAIGEITAKALRVADLCIVPITPSPADYWATESILTLIESARKKNPVLRTKLLISRKIVGTIAGREAREAIGRFQQPIFQTEICQRVSLTHAMAAGTTINYYDPFGDATYEFFSLASEVTHSRIGS